MKTNLRLFCFFSFLFLAGLNAFSQQKTEYFYKKTFKKIDSLALKAEPQQALVLINNLNAAARKDGNTAMLVKSVVYRMLFQSYLAEDVFAKNIGDLKQDIVLANQPTKSILQSLLAESYWKYYEQNRYRFYNRTNVAADIGGDIKTWSLAKLTSETINTYQASLNEITLLQNTKLNNLSEILLGDSVNRYLRPTLYDILAHRALDVYTNTQLNLTNTDDIIDFNDEAWFGDYKAFLESKIPNDSISFSVKAFNIFKALINEQINDENKAALADIELKRLKFIYQRSRFEEKQVAFFEALEKLYAYAKETVIAADILYEQASVCGNNQSYPDSKLDLIKAFSLAQIAIASYPKSIGATNSSSLIKKIKSKDLQVEIKQQNIPEKPIQVLYSYKNIDTIYLSLYKINVAGLDNNFNNQDTYNKFITDQKPIREWSVITPKEVDYKKHNLADKLEPLPLGNYVLLARSSIERSFKSNEAKTNVQCYSIFNASNLALRNRFLRENREYFVVNNASSEPVKAAKIEEENSYYTGNVKKNETKATILTNEKGYALSKTIERVDEALITFNRDSVIIPLNNYNYRNYEKEEEPRIILFTDRPIYRPGQTVFFKGVCIQADGFKNKILPNQYFSVTIKDVNWKEIKEILVNTNDYGTFQGSFVIPMGKLNGQMQLETEYGSISFQVEEYKRPTFELVFDKLNKKYKLNDSIKVTGRAISFAGYQVSGAKVTYKVTRSVFAPYGGYYGSYNAKQIAIGKTETKADGSFSIGFMASADGNFNGNYTYQVTIDVTDVNGETKTGVQQINAGKKDILLNVAIPQAVFLSSTPDSIFFDITNLNRQPIEAKLQTEWFKLENPDRILNKSPFNTKVEKYTLSQEEFTKNFPEYEFNGNADPMNWKSTKIDFSQNIKTQNGSGDIPVTAKIFQSGYYKVKFNAINVDNDTLTVEKIIRIFNADANVIQTASEWLVTEKNVITPSESAIFRLASPQANTKLYYEILYKDSVVTKVWIPVSPKQTIVKIKPELYFENAFAVQFTMVQNGILSQSLQMVNIVDESKQLEIKFLTFRDKLQPGEKESWKLRITNKLGEKRMAEMVATLYDASLDDLRPMNWNSFNPNYYNYYAYNWSSALNNVAQGNNLWFYRNNYEYFTPATHQYEQLNLFGYTYYGGYNSGYHQYLRLKELEARKDLREEANKRLSTLKNGAILYGVVKDKDGYALPGVIVMLDKIKVSTDKFGIYTINAKPKDKLVFMYLGYYSQTAIVATSKRLDIILKPDEKALNEVSVVGYGAQKKMSMTGSVSTMRYETLAGEGPRLKIRGLSSVANDGNGNLKAEMIETVAEDKTVYDFVSIDKPYDPKLGFAIVNGKAVRMSPKIIPRTNFNETAFFYPQLQTNEAGEISIDFTIPQSLTRYKMLGFAHTKDLATATISKTLITQKQLAISANAPRFFREGDTILFSAKLNNLSGKNLNGEATLELKDALTGKPISIFEKAKQAEQKFELADKGNIALKWTLIIPAGINAISYKVLAQADRFSDGEEMTIPILPNAILITESMPVSVRGGISKTFTMDRLLNSANLKTLRNQSLTFEFTSNPVWYAVQALPYLMEYPYECAEQTFSRFYANSFATAIINSSPKIKQVFNSWSTTNNGEAFLSNLEKNQELKSILLEETPWVRAAGNETERKKRLSALFNLNRMTSELKENFEKLEKMQYPTGSFPWFTGMKEDRYITQHIVLGIGQLKYLKLIDDKAFPGVNKMLNKAMIYLDNQLEKDFLNAKAGKEGWYLPLHYMFARSYTKQKNTGLNFNKANAFYTKKIISEWNKLGTYQQAQAALILERNGNHAEAIKIINLLKQRAQQTEEMGMYWTDNVNGWWWYENPIETQALLIEAFDEVAKDSKAVEEMKIWLLKNKQTNDWKTTKATTAACYALLMRGYNLLSESAEPEISIGGKPILEIEPKTSKEAGTGYQKITIQGANVKPEMAKVSIKNTNSTIAWGALYWQYYEKLDKVTSANTGIKIKKQLFLQNQTAKGDILIPLTEKNILKPGDLVKVRIEIIADRSMEYLHLKDMRSSGFEPVNVISRYKYQDGLGYYESTKDASTNFFISYMPKGVYVFEYPLRVTLAGNFSNGITTMQSMYAPEFTTHSEGMRVNVKP